MCVLTHSVDPSVFHFLAALWFIQSWGAEVTQWLAAFAKKMPFFFNLAHATTTRPLWVFNRLFRCVMRPDWWVCVCVSQCVRYRRACAVGWHTTRSRGRACAARQKQSARRAAALSCRRTASLVEAEEWREVLLACISVVASVRACVHSTNTDSLQRWAELEGAHGSRGVLIKLEKGWLKENIVAKTPISEFCVTYLLHTCTTIVSYLQTA